MAIKTVKKPDKIVNISSINANINPTLVDPAGLEESLYFNAFFDGDKIKKFVSACEKMIRSSNAYSAYLGNLKNDKEITTCSVLGNVDMQDADIEFHHYPFSLYDITNLIVTRHIINEDKFTTFSIAKEVLEEHSKNLIGLVSLCVTEHQLFHDGKVFIPLTQVYGKVNEFVLKYMDIMDDNMVEKYNKLVKLTEAYNKKSE